MKNCLIDLDAVFIKADGTIANIVNMKVPVQDKSLKYYRSKGPIKYAIELPAGTALRLGLAAGQKINMPEF